MAGGGLIVSPPAGAARVRDIHGDVGEVLVKRLATGNMMFANWDSFAEQLLTFFGEEG